MLRAHILLLAGLCATLSSAVTIDMEGLPDTGLDTSTWVTGVAPPLEDLYELNDLQIAAKNTLKPSSYASYRTGALDEITYQANLEIWQYIKLNGFTFKDVSDLNLNTSILGYNFSLPFFIAPAANAGLANSTTAELSLVEAAGDAGMLYVPSISSTKSIEQIASASVSPDQVMFHQEYVWSNKTRLQDELTRIEAAGFKAIFLTVDNTGINGIRTRSIRFTGEETDPGHASTFDLKALAAVRNMTSLPIVPKGIKTWQDAKTCLDLGFEAIYVSNHGGRVLDGAPTSVEVLLDIRKNAPEVFEKMEVYADGGVRRANHVITLLALGARAVGLGRSAMFSNLYGKEGVARMIYLLQTELGTSMKLMGESDVSAINSSYINTKWVENRYFGFGSS
ncbi:FMN-dependent alpha-hydroxy acid dehydrogenase [Athelia psychrophila]|uniref:FMN-dependent alpha-hydroxy acid dehydrogenase n=1 Tax=Athelia psychrophila TaxID=1759441 RepID=A0A166V389_9AGAM|nr:FMN-dependent alpha-hydroxy acid dehydrogenase [Fibularhizoctonia sp. CBS 109695]